MYIPDIIFKLDSKPKQSRYVAIEVLDPFTPLRAHKKRIEELTDYWPDFKSNKKLFILYICPNQTVSYMLTRYAKDEYDYDDTYRFAFIHYWELTDAKLSELYPLRSL